jgi:hypothetical protein
MHRFNFFFPFFLFFPSFPHYPSFLLSFCSLIFIEGVYMAASSVSFALSGPPNVFYGFWRSYGTSSLPPGPMLTVSAFWFNFIGAGIALLIAFVLSRLWRIFCALFFYFTFTDDETRRCSVEESQSHALLVNTKAPFSALISIVGAHQFYETKWETRGDFFRFIRRCRRRCRYSNFGCSDFDVQPGVDRVGYVYFQL